jgi:hypothetical protein
VRTACHSSSDFFTGYSMFLLADELNKAPRNGMGIEDLEIEARSCEFRVRLVAGKSRWVVLVMV